MMKRLAILLVAISLISVACSTGGTSEKEVTGTVTDVSYFTTAGAVNVTGIIIEEQDGTKHYLSTEGIKELFKEGQQIRVVFKEGGPYPSSQNSSMNTTEKFEENGVIKLIRVFWWTILEYEILS